MLNKREKKIYKRGKQEGFVQALGTIGVLGMFMLITAGVLIKTGIYVF